MSRTRNLAIALLVLTAVGDFAVVPRLLTTHHHRPPVVLPLIVAICAVASLAAACGLRLWAAWAPALSVGSRATDILSAAPVFFVGAGAGPTTGAAISIALSLLTILLVASVRHEQPTTRVAGRRVTV
jgi:hypothetical protein